MKHLYLLSACAVVLGLTSCGSHYAHRKNPVIFSAPGDASSYRLAQATIAGLARKRWRITRFEFGRVAAQYRGIKIQVLLPPDGTIQIHHLHGYMSHGNADALRGWLIGLEREIRAISFWDERRLNAVLKKYSIHTAEVERVSPKKD